MSGAAHKFTVNLLWTPRGVSKTFEKSLDMTVRGTLPDAIRIARVPNKLNYNDGEQIDTSGMVVHLLDENGNLWKSSDYPYGIIPLNEITIEPTIAISE